MKNNEFINENVEDIKINQFEKVQNEYLQGISLFNYKLRSLTKLASQIETQSYFIHLIST